MDGPTSPGSVNDEGVFEPFAIDRVPRTTFAKGDRFGVRYQHLSSFGVSTQIDVAMEVLATAGRRTPRTTTGSKKRTCSSSSAAGRRASGASASGCRPNTTSAFGRPRREDMSSTTPRRCPAPTQLTGRGYRQFSAMAYRPGVLANDISPGGDASAE